MSSLACNEIIGNKPPGSSADTGESGGAAGDASGGSDAGAAGGKKGHTGGKNAQGDGGQAGSATGGDGSGGDTSSASGGSTGTGGAEGDHVEGDVCRKEDEVVCSEDDQKQVLRCEKQIWAHQDRCSASENCDARTGGCADIVEDCLERSPLEKYCGDDHSIYRCSSDRITTSRVQNCPGLCDPNKVTCVDECAGDHGGCDSLVSCATTIDGPECGPCPSGYRLDTSGVCAPTLVTLALDNGTLQPNFSPETHEYSVSLGLFEDELTLEPEVTEGASFSINETEVEGDDWTGKLPLGSSTLSLSVSQDDRPSTDYQLNVTRGAQRHYLKSPTTAENERFGTSVALSGDGSTLVVGTAAGHVHVFVRSASSWSSQTTLTAPQSGANSGFGRQVALSHDGSTLVVGAAGEQVNGETYGAVYIFRRSATIWSQQFRLEGPIQSGFGSAVALSTEGDRLAVAAPAERTLAFGVNGTPSGVAPGSGAVYTFTRQSDQWTQEAFFKASNTEIGDGFGTSIALSPNGMVLAVGAKSEDSSTKTINGDESNNSLSSSGATYLFSRATGAWAQEAYIKANNAYLGAWFGTSVALSENGSILAVGAEYDDASFSGATYVFSKQNGQWQQDVYLKLPAPFPARDDDSFGYSVALSGDGTFLLASAPYEGSAAVGLNGNNSDVSADWAGATYAFVRTGNAWSQLAYIKASNTDGEDVFGTDVAMSFDGRTFVIAAPGEDSNATGLDGHQNDDSAADSGAVYIF